MKRILINSFLAGFALLTVPSFAQDKKETKVKKDLQQIIITRTGDTDEKTVIEIKGDKVTVNGKDAKDLRDSDVKVKVNKIKDVTAYRGGFTGPDFNFDFDFDHNNARALFSEDENRAMLGVVTDSDEKGARITTVNKESCAEKAGLKKDDIITKIDDAKVEDAEDVSQAIRKHKPGDKVSISFLRDGKQQKVTAELGKWKGIRMGANAFAIPRGERFEIAPGAPGAPFGFSFGGAPKLGLSVQDTEDGKGVKVLEVDEDSNAAKAGIKEDDVITHINDEAVNNADEIARKVRAARDKASLQFKVLRNGKTQNIEVKTPRKLKTADL
jgi:serine protease Do